MNCYHESCENEGRVWLPESCSLKSDVSLHHWCIHCGVVKNISDDRPKKMGYWTNVLSSIAKRFSLTQSQKRLVVKELESHECFDDLYGTAGSAQKEVFVKVVIKYCDLCESMIDSYIC